MFERSVLFPFGLRLNCVHACLAWRGVISCVRVVVCVRAGACICLFVCVSVHVCLCVYAIACARDVQSKGMPQL